MPNKMKTSEFNDAPGGLGAQNKGLQAMPALVASPELMSVTLASMGDAVITTDASGRVTFLNPVAQALTGWSQAEAVSLPLEKIFNIVNEESRKTVERPGARAW